MQRLRLCLFFVISVVCAEVPISYEGTTESPAIVLAKGRALQTLMIASMRQPESVARLGEVLPLLRSMTRQQRTVMKEMLQNATMAALHARPEANAARPSLGRMLPELNVASLLRRGDEELTRETNEAARARALESLEIVADTENVDTRAFASRNDTQLEEDVPEDMPVPEELRGRRLTPNELLALIAANKRLPQAELVALIAEHHRRISDPRRTSGGRPGHRVPPRTVVRGPQTSQRISVRPPEPSECDLFSNNLCLEVPNYPREAILASMQRNPTAVSAMLSHESRLDLGERRQDDTENLVLGEEAGQTLCQTAVKYARPKRARNVAGRWKFLVNMGSEHSQTMRIEVCNSPGEACHYLAQGVASQCVQLFSHHRLMAWDKEEGLHIDIFKVPTCCSCHVQPAYGPAMFPHASADTSHRPRHPTAEEAEPDFTEDDEYEDPESELQGSSFQKSRVPPHANWSPPNRPRRPTTSYQPPSPPTQTYQPTVVKQRPPIEITTFPPIFNKDLRKRNRYRNKNRQDSIDDLEDSETVAEPQIPPERKMPPKLTTTEAPHFLPTTLRPIMSRPPAHVVTNAPIIRPPPPRPAVPAIKQPTPIRRPSRPRPSQVETAEDGSRINYSYHPIIDFFREDQQLKQQQQINRRADKLVSAAGDEWRPIVPNNRASLRGA